MTSPGPWALNRVRRQRSKEVKFLTYTRQGNSSKFANTTSTMSGSPARSTNAWWNASAARNHPQITQITPKAVRAVQTPVFNPLLASFTGLKVLDVQPGELKTGKIEPELTQIHQESS